LKKLFFIVSIFFLSVTSSFAVFFVDAQGDYMSTTKYQPVTGFAAGIGFSLADDVNFLFRCAMAENTEHANLPEEIRYNYSAAAAGIEYIPPIGLLENYRLYWKNAVCVGVSEFEIKGNGSTTKDKTAGPGPIVSFQTGLQYNFTQVLSPYFDLGYHKSIYASTDPSIHGWQVAVGIRFYIAGSRDYDAGY